MAAVCALLLAAFTGPSGAPIDAALYDSHNAPARLSRFRGKPTIVFYEDHGSAHQNDTFKHELVARAHAHGLQTSAYVVAVADLRRYDFFPARSFALKAVRDAEKRNRVPVLVDWTGALSAPPWNLPPRASSVVVLDRQGRVAYVHSGPLGPADIQAAFERLAQVLQVNLSMLSPRGAP